MQDTRDDHEYDVRQNGLDGLSEDLDKQLEETLYDVTHNAEKQEQGRWSGKCGTSNIWNVKPRCWKLPTGL